MRAGGKEWERKKRRRPYMKICIPRAAQRILSKSAPVEADRGSRPGQREELLCDVISTEAPANLGKLH